MYGFLLPLRKLTTVVVICLVVIQDVEIFVVLVVVCVKGVVGPESHRALVATIQEGKNIPHPGIVLNHSDSGLNIPLTSSILGLYWHEPVCLDEHPGGSTRVKLMREDSRYSPEHALCLVMFVEDIVADVGVVVHGKLPLLVSLRLENGASVLDSIVDLRKASVSTQGTMTEAFGSTHRNVRLV